MAEGDLKRKDNKSMQQAKNTFKKQKLKRSRNGIHQRRRKRIEW